MFWDCSTKLIRICEYFSEWIKFPIIFQELTKLEKKEARFTDVNIDVEAWLINATCMYICIFWNLNTFHIHSSNNKGFQ